ncbi:MAG: hypothetical protein AAF911_12610 [Planctomycetota bacterium]
MLNGGGRILRRKLFCQFDQRLAKRTVDRGELFEDHGLDVDQYRPAVFGVR